ncbi:CAAX amino terminal protease family protein, partial [mine drainage metagenome]
MLLGREGLRAGWRVLIFLICAALLFVGLRLLLNHALMALAPGFLASLVSMASGKEPMSSAFAMLNDGFLLLAYLTVLAGMARWGRRRFTDYGLQGSRAWRYGLSGLFWGFAMLSALIGMLYVSGHLVFGRMPSLSLAVFDSGTLWAIASLMIAFTEENLFRGYLLFTL